MIQIKSPEEMRIMREGGKISRKILDYALGLCVAGVSTLEINNNVERKFNELDVKSWFNEVGGYPFGTCISVNEVWLHGLPNKNKLRVGDIVSVDIGVKYKGYYLDNCWTIVVQNGPVVRDLRNCFCHKDPNVTRFLKTGVKALYSAIDMFQAGNRIGDVSATMQKVVEEEGYSVIRGFSGHGVGRSYHEEPPISCYGTRGAGPKIRRGMTVAIEVMYTMGMAEYEIAGDKWSVVTKDGKFSSMFEHTVVFGEEGVEILTK